MFIENDVSAVDELGRIDSTGTNAHTGNGFGAFFIETREAVVFAGADGDELAAHRLEASNRAFDTTSSVWGRVQQKAGYMCAKSSVIVFWIGKWFAMVSEICRCGSFGGKPFDETTVLKRKV